MIDLAGIRARADAATRGPWHVELTAETYIDRPSRYPIYSDVRGIVEVAEGDTYVAQTMRGNAQARADAEFIAHAREDVAALLAEVERLRDALVQERMDNTPMSPMSDEQIEAWREEVRAELLREGKL